MYLLKNMEGSVLSENYAIIKHPSIMLRSVIFYLLISTTASSFRDWYSCTNIKKLIMVHNIISIVFSVYIFWGIAYHTHKNNYSWMDNKLDLSDTTLTHYMWIFHMTKYYECMDTFIMILRKSYRQISFLHVYHHSSMILYTWAVLYDHPGGDFYLGPMLNSFVHVWMYMYYLLSSFMNKQSKTKYLWWSKYLTQFQIVQFFVNLSHSIYTIRNTSYDTPVFKYGLYHQLSFIFLFGHFYYEKYKKNK